jgi:hypothetical protein
LYQGVVVSEPVVHLGGEWQPRELRLFRTASEQAAELTFDRGAATTVLTLFGPSRLDALTEIFMGIDFLEIFDRDREDGFHRDFGRYRVVYFIDGPFEFDADRYEVVDDCTSNCDAPTQQLT